MNLRWGVQGKEMNVPSRILLSSLLLVSNRTYATASSSDVRKLLVSASDDGLRLDRFLRLKCPGLPHAVICKLLRKRNILVTGQSFPAGNGSEAASYGTERAWNTNHNDGTEDEADHHPHMALSQAAATKVDVSTRLIAGQVVQLPAHVVVSSSSSTSSDVPVRLANTSTGSKKSSSLGRLLLDRVIYEDEHMLAVDKPCGLAVQGVRIAAIVSAPVAIAAVT